MEISVIKIVFVIHISHFISCNALPVALQSTTESISMETAIIFSHDKNPFDASSDSFKSKNQTIPKPNQIDTLPIVKLHRVLPLPKLLNNTRQQRLHVFRPLFVYRQEQAMRKQSKPRPPIDPDRYYNHPYHPYYPHYYPVQQQPPQQQQQHYLPYANEYGYPELYEPYPFKSYDYLSNDISSHRLPAYDFW